jgi:hypothetical protein
VFLKFRFLLSDEKWPAQMLVLRVDKQGLLDQTTGFDLIEVGLSLCPAI